MKYCHQCQRPINGFSYGFGYNKICSICNDQEQHQREQLRIQRELLQIEKKKLRILQKAGTF